MGQCTAYVNGKRCSKAAQKGRLYCSQHTFGGGFVYEASPGPTTQSEIDVIIKGIEGNKVPGKAADIHSLISRFIKEDASVCSKDFDIRAISFAKDKMREIQQKDADDTLRS